MRSAPSWLASARSRADLAPARPRDRLLLGGSDCGSIEPALARRLAALGLLQPAGDQWLVDAPADASLAAIAGRLYSEGLIGPWRDELLAVTGSDGREHGAVERAAARALGITTFAVHLLGCASDGRMWVQQRALDKATDPGLWDTLVGGQVTAGEAVETTLARETMEEAGLAIAHLRDLRRGERITVRRPVAEGYLLEHIDVFEATLPASSEPRNLDGEVARFDCLPADALQARLARGEFTLEATLMLGAWLMGEGAALQRGGN